MIEGRLTLDNWGTVPLTDETLMDQIGLVGYRQDRATPRPAIIMSPNAPEDRWCVQFYLHGDPYPSLCFDPKVVRRAWGIGVWTSMLLPQLLPTPADEWIDEERCIVRDAHVAELMRVRGQS